MRARTSNNFTYVMGSHAMQYGVLGMAAERSGDYEGMHNSGPGAGPAAAWTPPCASSSSPSPSSLSCERARLVGR